MLMVQDHVLASTADTNIKAAAHFGQLGKTDKQRTLLEAALILAEKLRNKALQTRINKLIAAIPTDMVAAPANPLKDKLIDLLERLGDVYSCESASDGDVFEVEADNIEAAIKETIKDRDVTVFVYPKLTDFNRMGGRKKAHKEFLQLVDEHTAVYCNAGDPEYYNPEDKGAPGGFVYAFFFKGAAANGRSLLVSFETAQT